MPDAPQPKPSTETERDAPPDRLCTWCKIPMTKRVVANGQFIHYTCPKCVFQHTTKRTTA